MARKKALILYIEPRPSLGLDYLSTTSYVRLQKLTILEDTRGDEWLYAINTPTGTQ